MRTPANVAGHPIHPMLVTIPIGLWIFSLVCDFIAMRSASPETWNVVALYALVGGIVGALVAAIPGLIDLVSLRDPAINVGVTECSTCKMQMEQGSSKPTIHPIKLLALAYGLMPEIGPLLTARGKELAVT